MSLGSSRGLAAGVTGFAILADALIARGILRADETTVWVLGRPIGWVCALRSRLGLPCPTCGLTRGLVLSLHGEWARAWHIAPAAPVAVCGLLAVSAGLLWLSATQVMGASRWEAGTKSILRYSTLAYAAAAIVVWLGGWAASLSAALRTF